MEEHERHVPEGEENRKVPTSDAAQEPPDWKKSDWREGFRKQDTDDLVKSVVYFRNVLGGDSSYGDDINDMDATAKRDFEVQLALAQEELKRRPSQSPYVP